MPTLFINPGNYTWACPANVYSILAECWGGGGCGGASGITYGGGGGGGGFGSKTVTTVPSTNYNVHVGSGNIWPPAGLGSFADNSYFDNSGVVSGDGGDDGGDGSGGNGGGGVGTTTHTGGNGASVGLIEGGGGGSSAGPSSNGNNGVNNVGGAAVTDGGAGGDGGPLTGGPALSGTYPGGGGGGEGPGGVGANGAGGFVRLTEYFTYFGESSGSLVINSSTSGDIKRFATIAESLVINSGFNASVIEPPMFSGIMPLYMAGGNELGPFGVGSSSGSFPLFLYSATGSGLSMFGTPFSGSMPLYLQGPSIQPFYASGLNLFIQGTTYSIDGSFPLYMVCSGVDGSINLFIQGSGVTEGATPFNGSMNLFLRRPCSDAIPLYLGAPGEPVSGSVYLYMQGNLPVSGGFNLYTNAVGPTTGNFPMFTAGF